MHKMHDAKCPNRKIRNALCNEIVLKNSVATRSIIATGRLF